MSSGNSDFVRIATAVFACLLPVSMLQAAGVMAQPANLYLSAERGSIVRSEITLSPTSGDTAVSIALAPFTIDERGQPRSCQCRMDRTLAGWGDVSTHGVSLTAGRRQSVTLELTVPASAEGSYWGVVLVEIEQTEVRSRLAIPVFLTVRGTEAPAVRLRELKAFRTKPNEIVVTGTVFDEGNTIVHSAPLFVVEEGSASAPVELASREDGVLTILPDGRRAFRLTINGDFPDPDVLRVTAWLRSGGKGGGTEAACRVSASPGCDGAGCHGA